MKKLLLTCAIAATLFSCNNANKDVPTLSGLDRTNFQASVNGWPTDLYVLTSKTGMEVTLTNYGARIVSVMVPDKDGNMQDVVLGFDSMDGYLSVANNLGATIGRYANRICKGQFVIDSVTYQVPQNNNGNCLHGGDEGWDTKVWKATQINPSSVKMELTSPDGDANFPGKVQATVTFTLTDDNAIDISYEATTDKKTVLNMTNHAYFNLSGDCNNSIVDNVLYINADTFTPIDTLSIPFGEHITVAGTPMDFRTAKPVSQAIDSLDFVQLKNGNGYDHNWVLNTNGDATVLAAKCVSPATGIALEVYTNEPGLQIYTGNFLDGAMTGKKGVVYNRRSAICLETQHYPDSPNNPTWPTTILEPGQTYKSQCIYKFTVEK